MAEISITAVATAALTVQSSTYGILINYMRHAATVTASQTGIDVFYSNGYLSKMMSLSDQMNKT